MADDRTIEALLQGPTMAPSQQQQQPYIIVVQVPQPASPPQPHHIAGNSTMDALVFLVLAAMAFLLALAWFRNPELTPQPTPTATTARRFTGGSPELSDRATAVPLATAVPTEQPTTVPTLAPTQTPVVIYWTATAVPPAPTDPPTAVPPTNTPVPTATAVPTSTPAPTVTPIPTATAAPTQPQVQRICADGTYSYDGWCGGGGAGW